MHLFHTLNDQNMQVVIDAWTTVVNKQEPWIFPELSFLKSEWSKNKYKIATCVFSNKAAFEWFNTFIYFKLQ